MISTPHSLKAYRNIGILFIVYYGIMSIAAITLLVTTPYGNPVLGINKWDNWDLVSIVVVILANITLIGYAGYCLIVSTYRVVNLQVAYKKYLTDHLDNLKSVLEKERSKNADRVESRIRDQQNEMLLKAISNTRDDIYRVRENNIASWEKTPEQG